MTAGQHNLTDRIAVSQEQQGHADIDRDDAIKAIRAALKRRSGRTWSVTGGKGTAWGWITIDAPPKRRRFNFDGTPTFSAYGYMHPLDRVELATLLGLDSVHHQGVSIPAGTDYRIEYVNRAEGRAPSAIGTPYWD